MTQKLDNVMKQNVYLTNQTNSWTSLAYCSSINGHNQNTIAAITLIINAPYRSNFMVILGFFQSGSKYCSFLRGYFGSWGHAFARCHCGEVEPL